MELYFHAAAPSPVIESTRRRLLSARDKIPFGDISLPFILPMNYERYHVYGERKKGNDIELVKSSKPLVPIGYLYW